MGTALRRQQAAECQEGLLGQGGRARHPTGVPTGAGDWHSLVLLRIVVF